MAVTKVKLKYQNSKVVNIKRNDNSEPTNFFLVKYEDSTTQTDTEAKESDNEHNKINLD